MLKKILYRDMSDSDVQDVSQLVKRVFEEFVAPGFSPEGIAEFNEYISPEEILKRKYIGHVFMIAEDSNGIVAMIEIKKYKHVSLFFVENRCRGKGIGKVLFEKALQKCRQSMPDLSVVSVNSSLYAVPIYKKLGFVKVRPEQTVHGIRFVPMELALAGIHKK